MNENGRTQSDTKQRILDAAEYLFAHDGYRGTSLRAITGKARVNLAAVNYHFGSKETLLEEVIRRRLLPLNRIRKERIEEVRENARKKGKKPDVKAVLLAFIEPTLLFKESSSEAENFVTFIGRSITDPDDTVRQVFHRFIKPLFHLLFETSCEALPEHPKDLVFWRLHFTIGSLFHTLHICGKFKPDDIVHVKTEMDAKTLVDLIIPYVTAGMRAK
ncbi:MAG: TetR/AcrR family transcriptional regulator [Nitrospirota bacterium]